jgi:ATP phosphoribosyltransferase
LMCYGENMPLDVLFVRDDDIPDLVQEDVCDLGLVGLNVVEESRLAFAARGVSPLFEMVQTLDFGRCKLCIAVPDNFEYRDAGSLQGKRIATTYPYILSRFLMDYGINAEVVVLSGAVEIAPRLGRADVICDLVSTGSTLAANHLRHVETVLESQAVLIRTPMPIAPEKQEWTRRLLMRIDGVEQVKGSKYIMLHAPRSALAAIAKILPGSEAPTVIPLEGLGDRVAVHAVCRENVFWELLEELKGAGATSVLVLPVEKMLA